MSETTTMRPDGFVTSDGARLRVIDDGPANAPVTVVFVHGWTLNKDSWSRVATALHGTGRVRTLRYDLRGHGDSEPARPGEASIARCAADLAELIAERVPAGPVVLVGHSMGGMTIMALAERSPELFEQRIAGVALVATSAGGLAEPSFGLPGPAAVAFNRGEKVLRGRLAAARGRRIGSSSGWLRPGIRWLLFGSRSTPSDVAATAQWVTSCHPASMAGFRESLAEHERYEALPVLANVPTVVLSGLSDRLTPHSHARRIADHLPQARLMLYPGAGHMLPLERTDEVAARIMQLIPEV